jgi:FAD synthetase
MENGKWNMGNMNKIVAFDQISKLGPSLPKTSTKLVLAGGCFDILHVGHLTFLEKAKQQGDTLVILLESDETITKSKGHGRPLNKQADRAKLLAAFEIVDVVVLLKPDMSNNDYDSLVIELEPAIIATTKGDRYRSHKERQAKLVNAKVVDVVDQIENKSTSKLITLLNEL